MFKKPSYISIVMTAIALIVGIIFFFFSSWAGNSDISAFPIFIIMILASITGMIFGIIGLFKDTGKLSISVGIVSIVVGIGFLLLLVLIILVGSNFGT